MTAQESFQAQVTDAGPLVRARLTGELDGVTSGDLLAAIEPLLDRAQDVTLDCSGLTFCDSMGLRALVMIQNALGDRGALVLEGAAPNLRRVLAITGLQKFLAEDATPST